MVPDPGPARRRQDARRHGSTRRTHPGGVLVEERGDLRPGGRTPSRSSTSPAQLRTTGPVPASVHDARRDGSPRRPSASPLRDLRPGEPRKPRTDLPQLAHQPDRRNSILLPEAPMARRPSPRSSAAAQGGAARLVQRGDRHRRAGPGLVGVPAFEHAARWTRTRVLLPDRSLVTVGGDNRIDDSPGPSAPSSSTTRSRAPGTPARARSRRANTTRPRSSCRMDASCRPETTCTRCQDADAVARRHRRDLLAPVSLQGAAAVDLARHRRRSAGTSRSRLGRRAKSTTPC